MSSGEFPIRFEDIIPVKLLVKQILDNAERYTWSLQGFGMLRLYLSREVRLHIWDSKYLIPGVTLVHDHPWDFSSYVVSGAIHNTRYLARPTTHREPTHMRQLIQCGPGACKMQEPADPFVLVPGQYQPSHHFTGSYYKQQSEEIHKTEADDGTVTLVTRSFKANTEHAHVFIPKGEDFVSAEPRQATSEEVHSITCLARVKLGV